MPPDGIDWVCVSPKAGADLVLRRGDELELVYPREGAEPEHSTPPFRHFFLQPMDGPDRERSTQLAVRDCRAHPQWRPSLQTHKCWAFCEVSMELLKESTFDAVHCLPNAPAEQSASRLHGHFSGRGPDPWHGGPETGWVIDFGEIKQAFLLIEDELDHTLLNEVYGLRIRSVSNLARLDLGSAASSAARPRSAVVRETCTSGCIYRGDDG